METVQTFGGWLRNRRRVLDLTQVELARLVNCAQVTIKKLEAGQLKPSSSLAVSLINQLDVPAHERDALIKFARGGPPPALSPHLLPKNNLPVKLTSFIGRERELAEVKRLLTISRLVTLTGDGGVGKTRLSIQAGMELLDHFPDGVWFVEFAPIANPDLLPGVILSKFKLNDQPNKTTLEILQNYLQNMQALLILDNCEHVIDSAARLALALLENSPRLEILTTSREALNVMGEIAWRLPSLSLPDIKRLPETAEQLTQYESVRLFIERASLVSSHFAVNKENAPAIAQICFHLDGIPLALELAAARIRTMTVEQINDHLDDRFQLLTDGNRTALPRQQTLRALIDWSYNLLSDSERKMLARLSVFAGGWTTASAKAVCAGDGIEPDDVMDLLSLLVNKSLATMGDEPDNEARYHLLETIRQYAQERLIQFGELQNMRLRHLEFFAKMVEEAEPNFKSGTQAVWYQRLDDEVDNLRVALNWLEGSENSEMRLRLGAGLWRYWKNRGQIREGREHLQRLLDSQPDDQSRRTPAYARALNAAGALAYYSGDFSFSEQARKDALEIFRVLDDKVGIANCLNGLGNVAISQANYESARSYYEAGLGIRKELGDRWGVARLLGNLGLLANFQFDYARARELHLESIALFRELQDEEGIASELIGIGEVARRQGDLATARDYYEQSKAIAEKLMDQWGLAYALEGIADVAFAQGDISTAASLYRECLILFQKVGDNIAFPDLFEAVASLMLAKDQPLKTALLFGAAVALRKKINSPLHPPDIADHNKAMSLLRERLDSSNLEAAWLEGYSMTLDQAVQYILKEPG